MADELPPVDPTSQSASLGLGYFSPRSTEVINADVAPAVAGAASIVSAVAFLAGAISCINFIIRHGGIDHGPYPWPWSARTFLTLCYRTANTLRDFSGPLLVGGVIACRNRARHAVRFLRWGLILNFASHAIFFVVNVITPLGGVSRLYTWVKYFLGFSQQLVLPGFLLMVLTRPAVEAEFVPRATGTEN